MTAKEKTRAWIVLGGLMVWIALNRLAAHYGLSYLFWAACGIAVILVVAAFVWKPRFRPEPDPGEEEKIAA